MKRSSFRVYRIFVLWLSLSAAQVWSIELARTVLNSAASQAGARWFDYESVQLTDENIKHIGDGPDAAKYARLFTFNNPETSNVPFTKTGECKVFPGDDAWPSETEWNVFNDLLGGALIPTIPIAAPCYQNWGIYDASKCSSIIANFTSTYFHEADPTSVMFPIWQGRTCLPINSPNGTCTRGGYPAYAVSVRNVAQIQLAVNFARNANIRLVVKNTGHCYLGKSGGAGSLSVWTHNLKDIEFIPNYQNGNFSGKAFKVGAGVVLRELYQAAHRHDVSVLGGICESVGYAGGYVQGGGHTPLSGLYGMAADHAMAFEVVTADGRFIAASETSNPDLYWALRGGGGSTFGIVTSVIVRAHPKHHITTSTFTLSTSTNISSDTLWEGIRAYFELFIPFTDAGTYSYFWVYNENGAQRLEMKPFFAPNHTIDSFHKLVKPWFDKLNSLGIQFTPKTTYYDSFYAAYNDNWGNETTGSWNRMPGNRLFPRSIWEDPKKLNHLVDILKRHTEISTSRTFSSYNQAPRNRANVDNAVSSAFRNVISFLISSVPIPNNATPSQMREAQQKLVNEVLGPWREIAPASEGGGSYLNEAHVMEPNWQEDFYGIQYSELLRLKRKWDPFDTFYATTAVGSERWEVRTAEQGIQTQNGRLCRL
ncbi:FAD/FMN-containing isoamyl alcohol oxidase-like protein MreA [Bisporella sp. PMI_857]|nr:FAD/FMN-containing isoamyl alcohol oxidase-like protein MreA [Bisporella sp. PMI_857]